MVHDAKPLSSPPYRASLKTKVLETVEIDKELAAVIVEPVQLKWVVPVLFVPKKDGRLRLCIDYRKVDTMTVEDTYLLPKMDECIDSLSGARYTTAIDAYSGYWQMRIRKQDRHNTAFVCQTGTFLCTRIPFRLTNAPACFQRALGIILTKYKRQMCLVYLEDVIIFSKTFDDLIIHVNENLATLVDGSVTLKFNSYYFFQKKVE